MKESRLRMRYLDIAKGLAILFMFAQHCMILHEVSVGEGSDFLSSLFILLGTAPAAPIFMLIMGIFLARSELSFSGYLWRGTKLILLGYLLNLLRFTIPLGILGEVGIPFSEGETPWDMLWAVDILQLAGLSLIVCGALKRFVAHRFVLPGVILAILLVSPWLWGTGGLFLDIFWGDSPSVYFPFFPWGVYPILGMYLSSHLLREKNLKERLNSLFLIGVVVLSLGGALFEFFPEGDYHRSGAGIHLLMIGFSLCWMRFCYSLAEMFRAEGLISRTLVFWSKNVTAMYFVQWVLFG
ncbi:MAG: acyltransferase, partial [Proteobacteria bacterium]|nr:acyltransferase [Pseudomonadota bacterium]